MKITVLGIGRLGICLALIFARSGHDVIGVDVNETYVKHINDKTLQSYEPSVMKYIQENKNFRATTNLREGLDHSDLVFIVVPTPNGGGEKFYDHTILSNLFITINKMNIEKKNFIIGCTVMPGYINNIAKLLIEDCKNCTINYNPEFIAQGNIIKDFENPDMILIGEENKEIGNKIQSVYETSCKNKPIYCRVTPLEAEITKISINGFVTTKLSYANMISDLCDKLGADKSRVLKSIGSDTRIGNKYFRPGYSFGGPCFPRDTKALGLFLKQNGVNNDLLTATQKYNEVHNEVLADELLKKHTWNSFENKHIADPLIIEDICYKENSNIPIIEESAKLKIAEFISKKGYKVIIKDEPHMIQEVKKEYGSMFNYEEKNIK